MALEDFMEAEVGIAIAATALATSPQVRNLVRRGLVYGLAGAMRAGNAVSTAARDVGQNAQHAASSAGSMVTEASAEANSPSTPSTRARKSPSSTVGNE